MLAQIIGRTIEAVADSWRGLTRAILLPALFLIFVYDILPLAIDPGFFSSAIELWAYSWLAVTVHRSVLLGEAGNTGWGWREIRFFFALFVMSFTIVLIVTTVNFSLKSIGTPSTGVLTWLIPVIIAAIALYWAAQYFLIFPAIAVDHRFSLAHSAVATEDHRVTTFLVVGIIPILLSLIVLPGIFISNYWVSALVTSLLSIISTTVGVALLSVLYKELVPFRS